ncbi:MAG: hypothetical protein IPN76_19155 [Saprospiraceae bacterium]|nr:hypothetical protein [Saprospiraceae bacterium]
MADVTLDSALNFIASQQPLLAQVGRTWTFDLGNLAVGDCGSFSIETFLDCDAAIGRAHLVTAMAMPSVLPPARPTMGRCQPQRVCRLRCGQCALLIANNGSGGMSDPLLSIIVEDQILTRAIQLQLEPFETQDFLHPTTTKRCASKCRKHLATPAGAAHR